MNRRHHIAHLRDATEPFDFVIIGGGATGLGAAVDATSRGRRVALIEQADFAKGTSSRSTKLIHGGLRYLKQGNVGLVTEALKERARLLQNAPHLVHDQTFVIPVYSWWKGSSLSLGLKFYDTLAGRSGGLAPSRRLSRAETLTYLPTVEPKDLTGGVLYHDGQFDDSRLAVSLAQTAVDHGAILANYCTCIGLVRRDGYVRGVMARDEETGEQFELKARAVINATGVFVDRLRRMEDPASKPLLAVSQGVHLVLPRAFLPGESALMIPNTEDGRVFFAVPWHNVVVAGTTDTLRTAPAMEPRALEEECAFILGQLRRHLSRQPTERDVLSVFAGLRPLVAKDEVSSTARLSREHTVLVGACGLVTVTGGKWTTYRRMAEDVVDCAEEVAGLDHSLSSTADLHIHGWTVDAMADRNLRVYGSEAEQVAELCASTPALSQLIHPALPYRMGEVVWHVRREMARTVEDVLARRTRALLLNALAAIEAAPKVAMLMAAELERDEEWEARQVEAFTKLARGYVYNDPLSRSDAVPPEAVEA